MRLVKGDNNKVKCSYQAIILDDNPDNNSIQLLRQELMAMSFQVQIVPNLRDAIWAVEASRRKDQEIDLMFIDMQLETVPNNIDVGIEIEDPDINNGLKKTAEEALNFDRNNEGSENDYLNIFTNIEQPIFKALLLYDRLNQKMAEVPNYGGIYAYVLLSILSPDSHKILYTQRGEVMADSRMIPFFIFPSRTLRIYRKQSSDKFDPRIMTEAMCTLHSVNSARIPLLGSCILKRFLPLLCQIRSGRNVEDVEDEIKVEDTKVNMRNMFPQIIILEKAKRNSPSLITELVNVSLKLLGSSLESQEVRNFINALSHFQPQEIDPLISLTYPLPFPVNQYFLGELLQLKFTNKKLQEGPPLENRLKNLAYFFQRNIYAGIWDLMQEVKGARNSSTLEVTISNQIDNDYLKIDLQNNRPYGRGKDFEYIIFRPLLDSLVSRLIDNCLKYDGSKVMFKLTSCATTVLLEYFDDSKGFGTLKSLKTGLWEGFEDFFRFVVMHRLERATVFAKDGSELDVLSFGEQCAPLPNDYNFGISIVFKSGGRP